MKLAKKEKIVACVAWGIGGLAAICTAPRAVAADTPATQSGAAGGAPSSMQAAGVAREAATGGTVTEAAVADGTTAEDLRIVVTAVQGQAEVKNDTQSGWRKLERGAVLAVGCQIRTGMPGSVQFMVGEDEVYRVDRLSLVRVVQADHAAGKIKTVVGMTYGRVSKDVDAPVMPHDDSIVSPGATLATRGTRVSLYDQPPYAPEAVSLTGTAIFHNLHGLLVQLGTHGGGTAKVAGDAAGPGQNQLQASVVDPNGAFSGRTAAEAIGEINIPSQTMAPPTNLLVAPIDFMATIQSFPMGGNGGGGNGSNNGGGNNGGGNNGGGNNGGGTPPTTAAGELEFPLSWTGAANTIVHFSVMSPGGDIVSPTSLTSADGGAYNTASKFSKTANSAGTGMQEIDWGNLSGGTYPLGTYTIVETFKGTINSPIIGAGDAIATQIGAGQLQKQVFNGSTTIVEDGAAPAKLTLNRVTESATFHVQVPILTQEPIKRDKSASRF